MPRRPRHPRPARLVLALVTALLLLGAAACGGTEPVDKETFQSELFERTNPEEGDEVVPEAVATCLTDKIFDEYDQGDRDRIYRAATSTELDEDMRATLAQFNKECFEEFGPPVAEEGASTTTTEADGSTTTDAGTEDSTTTTADDG